MKPLWDLIEQNLGNDFAADKKLQAAVRQMSEAFTEDRSRLPADYLRADRFERAYLAYYLPLNFSKVFAVLSSHKGVWPAELPTDRPLRWIDFGSGPGTAALAALAAYRHRYKKVEKLPPVQIHLVDTQSDALKLAQKLIPKFAEILGGLEVEVRLEKTIPNFKEPFYDLALAANVLNELPPEEGPNARETLLKLWDVSAGVFLVLEPGHRVSSQRLVRFRERLFKTHRSETRVLGPCPHLDRCPVYRTKHWCHFSEPVTDQRLIALNLRLFQNPRSWLKFSYLLVSRGEPVEWVPGKYRAIGDLHPSGPEAFAIDLCQPNEKHVLKTSRRIPAELRSQLVRGATVEVSKDGEVTARPMTKRVLKEPGGERTRGPQPGPRVTPRGRPEKRRNFRQKPRS